MESLWNPYGIPMESLWNPYGILMQSLWNPYGIRMESLCNPYGFAYCLLLIVYRLLHNAYCLLSMHERTVYCRMHSFLW